MSEHDLEYDLLTSATIREKVRDDTYARALYHSLCNTEWLPDEFLPMLRQRDDDFWGCSWRYAGSIVATLRDEGDYLDWYCSGNEGIIDPEVATDLKELGWLGRDEKGEWSVPS